MDTVILHITTTQESAAEVAQVLADTPGFGEVYRLADDPQIVAVMRLPQAAMAEEILAQVQQRLPQISAIHRREVVEALCAFDLTRY